MAHNCMTFSQIIMMTRIRVTHSRPVPSRAILRCRRRGGSQLPPTLYRIAVWFMGHVRECLPDVLILCLFTAPLQPRPWTFPCLSKSVKSRSLSSPIKWTHGSKTNNQNSPPHPSFHFIWRFHQQPPGPWPWSSFYTIINCWRNIRMLFSLLLSMKWNRIGKQLQ